MSRARSSSGPVKLRCRIWFRVMILAGRADRPATTSARIASTFPSRVLAAPLARPDSAARAASMASSGPGLAGPAARLPARPVHPGHGYPGRPQVTGQSRAVRAGAFHAGPGHRPGPGQPARQPPVPGQGSGELRYSQQPADRIQRGCHVHVQVGVHAACHRARNIYDGH